MRTVHPSLRDILQIPDAPPPRPRACLRVTGGRRVPAGPRAPDSWLRPKKYVRSSQKTITKGAGEIITEALPGCELPEVGSLLDLTLKELAKHWHWHLNYDQFFLATLPVHYKQTLLRYIAVYSPHGLGLSGLEVLFLDESEFEDATAAEGLTHLDLSKSIGHSLTLKDLRSFFASPNKGLSDPIPSDVPEDWDIPLLADFPLNSPRFHNVTHLSLSNPHETVTWKGLQDLTPHLTALTHLSLAYWPAPTLTPNSKTAYISSPQGNINYSSNTYYSAHDNEFLESASLIRRLARSTLCLQWLDLTGCYPWVRCLIYPQIDWAGTWGALSVVKIGQGWLPECFRANVNDGTWQTICQSRVAEDIRSDAAIQLAKWAEVENYTLDVEWIVTRRIGEILDNSEGVGKGNSSTDDPGEATRLVNTWDAGTPKTEETGKRTRSGRIHFERGWDAWWIKDALKKIC